MEPGPLLEDEFVSDPAAKLDAIANEQSQPYLKLRTLVEVPVDEGASQDPAETPVPDLTDFAIPESSAADLTPLVSVIETEPLPEPLPTPTSTSRVSLSRSWLVGLGALAFAAGLVTAVGARVLPTPTAKVVAPVETRPAPVAAAPAIAPPPESAAAAPTKPLATPPAMPAAMPTATPEAAPLPPSAPVIAQRIAAASVTNHGPAAAAPTEQRARGRATRAKGPARARVRASAETRDESAVAAPEDRRASPARGARGWVDPFAE
jgi:hypothetical protein